MYRIERKQSFYEKYIKRIFDIVCSFLTLIFFCWLYAIIAVAVRIRMGAPILFRQPRPGMIDPETNKERIFDMYKFRTMTDERDENGELLPDAKRLPVFGKIMRRTSLDELPEVVNILKGDMSIIGPRPQLVRDMVFMTDEERMRHTAKPGLSGLAQVMGRNAITWDEKMYWDLKYIEKISFLGDLRLVWLTFKKILFGFKSAEASAETDITYDYGDVLLHSGRVSQAKYEALQEYAKNLIQEYEGRR